MNTMTEDEFVEISNLRVVKAASAVLDQILPHPIKSLDENVREARRLLRLTYEQLSKDVGPLAGAKIYLDGEQLKRDTEHALLEGHMIHAIEAIKKQGYKVHITKQINR
jgi:hypothetical protein